MSIAHPAVKLPRATFSRPRRTDHLV